MPRSGVLFLAHLSKSVRRWSRNSSRWPLTAFHVFDGSKYLQTSTTLNRVVAKFLKVQENILYFKTEIGSLALQPKAPAAGGCSPLLHPPPSGAPAQAREVHLNPLANLWRIMKPMQNRQKSSPKTRNYLIRFPNLKLFGRSLVLGTSGVHDLALISQFLAPSKDPVMRRNQQKP